MQGRLVHPFVTRCIDGVAQVFEVQVGVDLRGVMLAWSMSSCTWRWDTPAVIMSWPKA